MKTIGFRSSPQGVRYAIVEFNGSSATLVNADTESRLVYPAGMDSLEDRLVWLSDEIDRIIHQNGGIDKAVIKANEYVGTETKTKRASISSDAVIMLCCAKANIPVAAKIYGSLGSTSTKVKDHAEHRVGRTTKYWDQKMADAVVAAWSGRK